jgi:hypothetical protein
MRTMSKRQTNAIALSKAMGRLRVLAVGIDDYDKTYGKLKTCSNDAKAVVECFLDVHQLNADKSSVSYCTSTTAPRLTLGPRSVTYPTVWRDQKKGGATQRVKVSTR